MESKQLHEAVLANIDEVIAQVTPQGVSLWQSFLEMHPADSAQLLTHLSDDRLIKLFLKLSQTKQLELFEELRAANKQAVFHLWGHSWELEKNNDWDRLESVLPHICNHTDVQDGTNCDIVRWRGFSRATKKMPRRCGACASCLDMRDSMTNFADRNDCGQRLKSGYAFTAWEFRL